MTRAAIYVRVSTARQAERDLSMPDQIAQCRQFCDQRGWEIVQVFEEPGASALDEGRPVFQELIYRATGPDRPFDFVVDTGTNRSVISDQLAGMLGLPAGRLVHLHGIGGEREVPTAALNRFDVGGRAASKLSLPVLPLKSLQLLASCRSRF